MGSRNFILITSLIHCCILYVYTHLYTWIFSLIWICINLYKIKNLKFENRHYELNSGINRSGVLLANLSEDLKNKVLVNAYKKYSNHFI